MPIRFYYDNLWKLYDTTPSTEQINYPASNTENRFPDEPWRSNYGAGSGWGRFVITASVYDRLDFEETAGVNLAAILNPGTYNADTLAAHIKAQMEAVGASTYTVEFLESGTSKLHWRITSNGAGGGGILNLEWSTGPNTARSIGSSLGFIVSADDTGALTYTSDYVAIHTSEILDKDLGISTAIYGFIIKGHNFGSGAMLQILGSNDADFSTGANVTITITADIIQRIWTTAQTYRYWRTVITNPTNPEGYIEIGNICLSPHFAPLRNIAPGKTGGPEDLSLKMSSTGGQQRSIQLPRLDRFDYLFMATNEKSSFDAMWEYVGQSKELYYVEDSDSPATTVRMAEIASYKWAHLAGSYYNISLTLKELV